MFAFALAALVASLVPSTIPFLLDVKAKVLGTRVLAKTSNAVFKDDFSETLQLKKPLSYRHGRYLSSESHLAALHQKKKFYRETNPVFRNIF